MLWQTEGFLCCCRKENYNSSERSLADEGMGGISLGILMWRVGQGLSSQDRRPLEGMKGEKRDVLLFVCSLLSPASPCSQLQAVVSSVCRDTALINGML